MSMYLISWVIGKNLPEGISDFVKSLGIQQRDKVLDYCSGSGMIAKGIAGLLKDGLLVYAEEYYLPQDGLFW
ncbi:hypothetical protein [Geosporobacter subterraneus]|uniref:hypothetical protein n=1 Tax=Geosporobacter subterraneus TaxID=390806 RepID=UPI001674E452|nr:hypothetical protein [Geosporobacter subterraneus]